MLESQTIEEKELWEILTKHGVIKEEDLIDSFSNQTDMTFMPIAQDYQSYLSGVSFNKNKNIYRYIKTMSFFIEIGTLIGENPDINSLLNLIAKEAPIIMEAERSSIFLIDKEEKELWSWVALGIDDKKIHFEKNRGIAGHVFHSGKLLNITDVYDSPLFNQKVDKTTGYKTNNILCVPLTNSNKNTFGVFEVLNKKTGNFTEEDEVLIQFIASQISIAFENINNWNELKLLKENLLKENLSLKRETQREYGFFQIIGLNNKLINILKTVKQAACFNIPVTIEGESGTGKELIAKAIHYNSERAERPFICVNCSAIPENLLESELFGFEKGAFTGAESSKPGLFEEANKGTIFLDEIGDMDPRLQVKILRFLESGEIQKLGTNKIKKVDVRIIAATNRNLVNLMKEKKFREDLYYRINVINLHLPPLRERKDDILLLIKHFLKKFGPTLNKNIKGITNDAQDLLLMHDFPGNIRELENIIKRALVISEGEWITIKHLPYTIRLLATKKTGSIEGDFFSSIPQDYTKYKEIKTRAKRKLQEDLDKSFIVELLKQNKGNVCNAAKSAKMNRSLLHQMITKYKIDIWQYR